LPKLVVARPLGELDLHDQEPFNPNSRYHGGRDNQQKTSIVFYANPLYRFVEADFDGQRYSVALSTLGFPIAHLFYKLLINAPDRFRWERTSLGPLLSPFYYLLFPARNKYRLPGFALNVAYLFDHPCPFLYKLNNALVQGINLFTACYQPFLSSNLGV
jgi:hypothetical protein